MNRTEISIKKPKPECAVPLPVPYKFVISKDFFPKIYPIPIILKDDFKGLFHSIEFKKDRGQLGRIIAGNVESQIPEELVGKATGVAAMFDVTALTSETGNPIPDKYQKFLNTKCLTKEGAPLFNAEVHDLKQKYKKDIIDVAGETMIVGELFKLAATVPKKPAKGCMPMPASLKDVDYWSYPKEIFDNVYPPIRNAHLKPFKHFLCNLDGKTGLSYSFLRHISKQGMTPAKGEYNNEKTVLSAFEKKSNIRQSKLKHLIQMIKGSDKQQQENTALIKNTIKLYNKTKGFVHVTKCGHYENMLFPLDKLPSDLEIRQNALDMKPGLIGGDICERADIVYHRKGTWGENPINTWLGYKSDFIKDKAEIQTLKGLLRNSKKKK